MKKSMMIIWVLIVLVVVVVLVFLTIKMKKSNKMAENNEATTSLSTGAVAGDKVSVIYTGKLADGTVFDSNVGKNVLTFTLGAHEVIPGFENGIVGMKVGDKKTLTIPPEEGYGAKDYGPIPGNSTLTFDVEVTNITSGTAQE